MYKQPGFLEDNPFPKVTETTAIAWDLMDYRISSRQMPGLYLKLGHMLTNYLQLVSSLIFLEFYGILTSVSY
jgi:hypothetical protein